MAHLLGSRTCIESLHDDIEDLQTILHQILNETGSLKCHSWKYPDRLATDVDIVELLQRYQYGKNQVDNQVTHIVLFELIIDRLLLIFYGSWRFFHTIQSEILPSTPSAIENTTSLNVGLVVKKYWTKLSQLSTLLQQHRCSTPTTSLSPSSPSSSPSRSTQTIETSFSSCSLCQNFEETLEKTGKSLIELCHQLNLPSLLVHHRCLTNPQPINTTVDDLRQWNDDQTKDFLNIGKHFVSLTNQLTKKRDEIKSNEIQRKKNDETIRQLQQTINEDKQTRRILQDLHETKQNEMKKDFQREISQLNDQIQSLTKEKSQLKDQLTNLAEKCRIQTEQLIEFDSTKTQLKILTDERRENLQQLKENETNRIRLETELDVIKRELDERQRDLQKDRFRIENLIRQEQNSQSLITAHKILTEEHQLLKQKFVDLESERNELLKIPKRLSDQDESTQTNSTIPTEFFEIVSNVDEISSNKTQRNLRIDLQKQIQTNELHIELLEKQNESLRCSMSKLTSLDRPSTATSNVVETKKTPIRSAPLFLLNTEILEQETQREQTPSPSSLTVNKKRSARSTSAMTFRCVLCLKTFSDKRNFDIHKMYCRT